MTCPWRALQYPLVKEVIEIASAAEKGMGMAYVDSETPAVVLDALSLYTQARAASYAHHMNAYHEEQRRKHKQR